MPNSNTNQYIKDALKEQKLRILEERNRCVDIYGENVISKNVTSLYNHTTDSFYCPATWDEITCWPPVAAGTIATKNCSSLFYVKGFVLENIVTKRCLQNGQWFIKNGVYWTNFTQCHQNGTKLILTDPKITNGSSLLMEYLPLIKVIKETGYAISLLTLIIAFSIMVSIKKLHCTRNILHMHLFASFILRAFIFLLKDIIFVDGLGLQSDLLGLGNDTFFNMDSSTNNWQCKLLTSLWQYFTLANYFWILMEGFYLYNLIFRALFADSSESIIGYVIIGWGLPFIFIGLWAIGRISIEDAFCWTMMNSEIYLFIEIPTLISVIVNLILFVRISLVILNKLKPPLNANSKKYYMKWAKSTLVLVPLFGVNYVLFLGLRFFTGDVVELVWIVCDSLFGSFQGLFVAVLYCFLNGEVKAELKLFFYEILPFLATSRIFRIFCPCKERVLRSSHGRISVCTTTLSCSSMCANGLIQSRNNVRNKDCHHCHSKRLSQDVLACDSTRTSMNLLQSRKDSNPLRIQNNDSLEMTNLCYSDRKQSQEEYISMLPKKC